MVAEVKQEQLSLEFLARLPQDAAACLFVSHLMLALSSVGITELSAARGEPRVRLYRALLVINDHSEKMAVGNMGVDRLRVRAFQRICSAIGPSLIGNFDTFWHYVCQSRADWRMDGHYFLPFPQAFAQNHLNEAFDPKYRWLLRSYARVIRRKLAGW